MRAVAAVAAGFGIGCAPPPSCAPPERPPSGLGGDLLLVVLDDVGIDRIGAYGAHPDPADTPRLDALAERGVRFDAAYNQPVCSPGRAALLTGRRAVRTGVGANVHPGGRTPGLPSDEVTLPEALREAPGGPYATAAIGKWHLSPFGRGFFEDPREHGFDRFDGLIANAGNVSMIEHPVDYFRWESIVDGVARERTGYLTTDQADAAIAAMTHAPSPWFVYLAFNGIHTPLHTPPPSLWSGPEPASDAERADAMLTALDRELGRVLDAAGDDAWVFVTSDNGTSREAARAPLAPDRAKGSLFSGGTRVPLLVSGPGVEPRAVDGLVHAVDVFATLLDLAGIAPSDLGVEVDGASLLPVLLGEQARPARRCLVIDVFGREGPVPGGFAQAFVSDRHLLLERPPRDESFFRRGPADPWEGRNLLLSERGVDADDRSALRWLRSVARGDARTLEGRGE